MAKPSVFAADLEVTGRIHSTGDLIVQAQITGDITAENVAIHEWATVNGDVEAKQLLVEGRVDGRILAGNVVLSPSGKVSGVLHYMSLAVETGAVIDGDLRTIARTDLLQKD